MQTVFCQLTSVITFSSHSCWTTWLPCFTGTEHFLADPEVMWSNTGFKALSAAALFPWPDSYFRPPRISACHAKLILEHNKILLDFLQSIIHSQWYRKGDLVVMLWGGGAECHYPSIVYFTQYLLHNSTVFFHHLHLHRSPLCRRLVGLWLQVQTSILFLDGWRGIRQCTQPVWK